MPIARRWALLPLLPAAVLPVVGCGAPSLDPAFVIRNDTAERVTIIVCKDLTCASRADHRGVDAGRTAEIGFDPGLGGVVAVEAADPGVPLRCLSIGTDFANEPSLYDVSRAGPCDRAHVPTARSG